MEPKNDTHPITSQIWIYVYDSTAARVGVCGTYPRDTLRPAGLELPFLLLSSARSIRIPCTRAS